MFEERFCICWVYGVFSNLTVLLSMNWLSMGQKKSSLKCLCLCSTGKITVYRFILEKQLPFSGPPGESTMSICLFFPFEGHHALLLKNSTAHFPH